MAQSNPGFTSPVAQNTQFARIDQGADYQQNVPYKAVGAGHVYAVTGGFAGGTDTAVYIRLYTPVKINGRSYSEVYYAETEPLVKVGQRVRAGQPVTGPGAAELGFAQGTAPMAPLVGGLGAGTQPTREGQDFFDFIHNTPTTDEHGQVVAAIPGVIVKDGKVTPDAIDAAADRHGVPPALFRGLIYQESRFHTDSTPNLDNAVGPAQVVGGSPDPWTNLNQGAAMLKNYLQTFGNTEKALAAYNAGPNAVRDNWPGVLNYLNSPSNPKSSVRNYIASVTSYAKQNPGTGPKFTSTIPTLGTAESSAGWQTPATGGLSSGGNPYQAEAAGSAAANATGTTAGTVSGITAAAGSPGILDLSTVTSGPPIPQTTTPLAMAPGTGDLSGGNGQIGWLWSEIASAPGASAETLALAGTAAG